MTICTHDGLTRGQELRQVKSVVRKKWCIILVCTHEILAGGRVPRFWSTYIHMHDRLDESRSALADARLKIAKLTKKCHLFLRHCDIKVIYVPVKSI